MGQKRVIKPAPGLFEEYHWEKSSGSNPSSGLIHEGHCYAAPEAPPRQENHQAGGLERVN